jgi:hypothetical protein
MEAGAAAAAAAARDATRIARDDAACRRATREARDLLSRLSRGEGDVAATCHSLAQLVEREQRRRGSKLRAAKRRAACAVLSGLCR